MNSPPAKKAFRFHPYGNENKPPVVVNPKLKQSTFQFNRATQASSRPQIKSIEESYDLNHYLQNPNDPRPFQTQVLKNSTNEKTSGVRRQSTKSSSTTKSHGASRTSQLKELRIFSGTTRSILTFEKQKSSIKEDLGPYYFEIVAQLDSVISEDDSGISGREFTLKDLYGRIHCIFYEMDRTMETYCRDSYLRCVGRVNRKSGLFQCVSARLATEKEMLYFGFLVNQSYSQFRVIFSNRN